MMADISETTPGDGAVIPDAVGQNPAVHGAAGSFRRSALAATVGTTIEWYDFQVYGLAAALICGYITFRLGLSPIVGYLLAGLLVGPKTPG